MVPARSSKRAILRWAREGPYTYDRISLSNAHAITQLVQRLHILLAAFSHGNIFHNEAFVSPGGHRLHVKVLIFSGDIQHRSAVIERQPPISVRKELQSHV
jgi:hypothetical protein